MSSVSAKVETFFLNFLLSVVRSFPAMEIDSEKIHERKHSDYNSLVRNLLLYLLVARADGILCRRRLFLVIRLRVRVCNLTLSFWFQLKQDERFEIQKEMYRGQQYSQIYFARLHLMRTLLYSLAPTWKPHLPGQCFCFSPFNFMFNATNLGIFFGIFAIFWITVEKDC